MLCAGESENMGTLEDNPSPDGAALNSNYYQYRMEAVTRETQENKRYVCEIKVPLYKEMTSRRKP